MAYTNMLDIFGIDVLWKMKSREVPRVFIFCTVSSSDELFLLDRILFSINLNRDMEHVIVCTDFPSHAKARDILLQFGANANVFHGRCVNLPSLKELIMEPILKKKVWEKIKGIL